MHTPELTWAGHAWRRLQDVDVGRLAQELDHAEIARWLGHGRPGTVRDKLEWRLTGEAAGRSIHLVPHRGDRPLGFTALLPYPGRTGALQTSVYLARSEWGTGLFTSCAVLLWELRRLLGHTRLVASSHALNRRSQAARAKTARGQTGVLTWEPWWPRLAVVYELTGPPTGSTTLDTTARSALRDLVVDQLDRPRPATVPPLAA